MKNIAIFASGSGTNAENIIHYFSGSDLARVVLLVADNPDAYALERARKYGVPAAVIPRADFRGGGAQALDALRTNSIDYIILAGFLSLVPPAIIGAYRHRIINIHPALLPKYGGKGMYGDRVHCAVVENGECESGITIHHVDEVYDSGSMIAQYKVGVTPEDTPQTLAAKIHELEYRHFPRVIEQVVSLDEPLKNMKPLTGRDRRAIGDAETPYVVCMAIGAGIAILLSLQYLSRINFDLRGPGSIIALFLVFIAGTFCFGQLVRYAVNRKYYKALKGGTKIIVPAMLQYKEAKPGQTDAGSTYYLVVNNIRYRTDKDIFDRVNEGELIEAHAVPKSFTPSGSDVKQAGGKATLHIDAHIATTYFIFLGFHPYGQNRK